MLKVYIITVISYAISISGTISMSKSKIIENGWVDGVGKFETNKWMMSFCLAAVPLFRLMVLIILYYMFITKKEDIKKKGK